MKKPSCYECGLSFEWKNRNSIYWMYDPNIKTGVKTTIQPDVKNIYPTCSPCSRYLEQYLNWSCMGVSNNMYKNKQDNNESDFDLENTKKKLLY